MDNRRSSPAGRPNADSELLRLCDLFHRQQAQVAAVPNNDEDASDEALNRRWDTVDAIQAIRAKTIPGVRAKAAIALFLLQEDGGDSRLAVALLRDIAGASAA